MGLSLQSFHSCGQLLALAFEHGRVHQHARVLHFLQHADQWLLDVLIKIAQLGNRFQPWPEGVVQLQSDIRVLGSIGTGRFHRHLVETQLLGTLASNVLVVGGFYAQILSGHGIHVVARGRAVQHIGLQHGVETHAG